MSKEIPSLSRFRYKILRAFLAPALLFLQSTSVAAQEMPMLSDETLEQYRQALLEPLAVWVARRFFIAKVVPDVEFPLVIPTHASLDSREELTELEPLFDGSTALSAEQLSRLDSLPLYTAGVNELSESVSASEILWNSRRALNRFSNSLHEVDIHWFSAQSLTKQASGVYFQAKKLSIETSGGEQSTPQEYARVALFQLQQPAVASGYSQLFLQNESRADAYYLFSPVIGKVRRLPLAIRSDEMLQGQLSPEDLFVFQFRPSDFRVRFLEGKELLVFFGAKTPLPVDVVKRAVASVENPIAEQQGAEQQGAENPGEELVRAPLLRIEGRHASPNGTTSMARWNGVQQQFSQFVPWMSLSSVLVPRSTLLFEIIPRDPFSSWGRAIVVLDAQTLLPVYKLVYSNWGALQRVVIGSWVIGKNKESEAVYPVVSSVIAILANGGQATSATTRSVEFENGASAEQSNFIHWRELATPTALGQLAEQQEQDEAKNKELEQQKASSANKPKPASVGGVAPHL